MDRDFRAFLETPDPGAKPPRRHRGYNAFGWAVCFLLLMGVVMASWIGSFYVFNHPENPDCYHFLKELNRIEPLKRFEVTAAPPGKFFTAKELYDAYITMPPAELDEKNNGLLRDYLRNYANMKTPVPYISGRFTTTGVYELGKTDMFPSGMVAVANSTDCPYVQIEHIYPTDFANVPRARQMLATEPEIDLEKTFDLSTIVHVERMQDGRMLFTVLPLAYGQYAYKQGISSTFRLDPPASLNLEAGMPVVKADAMESAVKIFALYRKNRGMLTKGKTLTVPPAAPLQTTDLLTAQDIPPEATQPLKPAITTPAAEPVPENTVAAASAPPMATPVPVEAVPPVTMPSSPDAERVAQAPAAPPSAAPIQEPAPAPPVASISAPVIVKIPPSLPPPVVAATAPVAPVLSHAAAPAKLEKSVAKTSALAPSPSAPVVKSIAHIQPNQPNPAPATAIAATRPAVVSKPAVSLATVSHAPVKPAMVPAPTPVEYAVAASPALPAPGVKLDPFLASQPAPVQPPQQQAVAPARTSTWQTYRPGMMPRGKLINTYNAMQLADLGIGRDPVYMQGRFIVTASSDGRVVLRPANLNGGISGTTMRMLVEYPSGTRIPAEGTQIARGSLRPFQIIDVRRGNDGEVNVYAREVTEPASEASPYAVRYYPNRTVQRDNAFY